MTEIKKEVVTRIRVLIDRGEEQTKIAKKLGVGRSTVNAIARGRRKLKHEQDEDPAEILRIKYKDIDSRRCPAFCHYTITISPCLACLMIIEQRIRNEHVQKGLDPLTKYQLSLAALAEYRHLEKKNGNGSKKP